MNVPATALDLPSCTVSAEHPSIFIKAAALLTLFQHFVVRHDHEETKLFAENLAKRAA